MKLIVNPAQCQLIRFNKKPLITYSEQNGWHKAKKSGDNRGQLNFLLGQVKSFLIVSSG